MNITITGLPGRMSSQFLDELVLQEGINSFIPLSLTGPEIKEKSTMIHFPSRKIDVGMSLYTPNCRDEFLKDLSTFVNRDQDPSVVRFGDRFGSVIAVDYSLPDAVMDNVDFYCKNGINFVLGTTGGDYKEIAKRVSRSTISAVVAPNMGKQIVVFQEMMKYAAENFPGAFDGYDLRVTESHQAGKKDTSGTAKAVVSVLNLLTGKEMPDGFTMVREPEAQLKMGVPEQYLGGHGWHTYNLTSPDGTVMFSFTHNVNGRAIYAKGTVDAVRFLDRKLRDGTVTLGHTYSMKDVLTEFS